MSAEKRSIFGKIFYPSFVPAGLFSPLFLFVQPLSASGCPFFPRVLFLHSSQPWSSFQMTIGYFFASGCPFHTGPLYLVGPYDLRNIRSTSMLLAQWFPDLFLCQKMTRCFFASGCLFRTGPLYLVRPSDPRNIQPPMMLRPR